MSGKNGNAEIGDNDDNDSTTKMTADLENVDLADSLYRPPAQKTVREILDADKDDESLRKYKEKLLGSLTATAGAPVLLEPDNPKNVLVKSLVLIIDNRPEITMDLSEMNNLDKKTFVIKEGCHYRLKINFFVQREIVQGLRYVQKAHRMGVQVHKDDYMVGSYAPKIESQSFTTPAEEAPSGMINRGTYKMKSLFTDDDKNEWLSWEWNLEIKKDWD